MSTNITFKFASIAILAGYVSARIASLTPIGSIGDANKVLNFLYKDASIFLNRKYNLFKEASAILAKKLMH
jgi:hypothetical protein